MPMPSPETLRRLATSTGDPAISIYMPVLRAGKDLRQNPTRLRNLIREAESRFQEAGRPGRAEVAKLLEPAGALVEDSEFWRDQGEGLALFLTEGMNQSFKLPIPVQELAFVGGHFYLRPLLLAGAPGRKFYVLSVNRKEVQMFECSLDSVEPVDLGDTPTRFLDYVGHGTEEQHLQWHTRAPAGGGERAAVFHGQGGGSDDVKPELRKFLLAVDAGVRRVLNGKEAPLVLVGLEYLLAIYREASSYPHLTTEEVRIDAATMSPEALRDEGLKIVKPLFDRDRETALERFGLALGKGRGASRLEEILPAAHDGRVETLLLAHGAKQWGTYDPEGRRMELREELAAGVDELFDLSAIETIRHGGAVHGFEEQELSAADGPIGAIFRY